jgi:hypothetical protein
MSDPLKPFRELMIPLSGVVQMSLLQRDDKKIFLIGEMHTQKFCRHKGFTPLCSILEEYLQTRTKDEPVDFMLEMDEYHYSLHPLEETRGICRKRVNTSYPSDSDTTHTLVLVRDMVDQYIPLAKNEIRVMYEGKLLPQKTVVQLPNARVHWLDPSFTHKGRVDRLLEYMVLYNNVYSRRDATYLYTIRTLINHLLEIGPEDGIPWVLHEPRVIDMFNNDPNELGTVVFDTIPDRTLFFQSSESSKIAFFKKVYDKLIESKYFKKCYSGNRFIEWKILRNAFIERWRKFANTIESFYYCVQRFLMDFFTCCRILKEEGRWYKNIVIYAGFGHTENIERILLSLDFKNVDLPPIHYDPECSGTRKQRKTRRNKDVKP